MNTGSVNGKRRCKHPFINRSVENVERVLEMWMHSLQKSTHQAAHESKLTRYVVLSMLHKELNGHLWNPHCMQELRPADCECRMECRGLMLGWHGVNGEIRVVLMLKYDYLA